MKLLLTTLILLPLFFITPTGEDEGMELYVISTPAIEYEYATQEEVDTFLETGEIRGDSYNINH